MMSQLEDYLIDNIAAVEETQEIILSERLRDFKFKIRPIDGQYFSKVKTEHRKLKKKQVIFDEAGFNEKIILKGCVEPNFSDVNFIEKAGCKTPSELIYTVLKAGEIVDLANQITNLSGFEDDMDELVEEAKN